MVPTAKPRVSNRRPRNREQIQTKVDPPFQTPHRVIAPDEGLTELARTQMAPLPVDVRLRNIFHVSRSFAELRRHTRGSDGSIEIAERPFTPSLAGIE
jgi:hypothetical protein